MTENAINRIWEKITFSIGMRYRLVYNEDMKKNKGFSKSISLIEGNENTTLFLNTVSFFSTYQNVTDSKLIMEGVVERYFPEEFLCREAFIYCLKNPSDDRFSSIFYTFFGRFFEFPEPVRCASKEMLWKLINYFDSVLKPVCVVPDHKYYIDSRLGFIIKDFEYKKEFDSDFDNSDDRILFNLNFLRNQWKIEPSRANLVDIFRLIVSNWETFCNDGSAIQIVTVGFDMYNIIFSIDRFCEIYSVFDKLSRMNYILKGGGKL